MKGLLKGLRYISQIFEFKEEERGEEQEEEEEEEGEMQIGHPTDVKHVAHVGWDGPVSAPPPWKMEVKKEPEMNEFQSAPSLDSEAAGNQQIPSRPHESNGPKVNGRITQTNPSGDDSPKLDQNSPSMDNSSGRDEPPAARQSSDAPAPRSSRRHSSSVSVPSTNEFTSMAPRRSRRHSSTDSLDGSTPRNRRHQQVKDPECGSEFKGHDPMPVPRKVRPKKKMGPSQDGTADQSKELIGSSDLHRKENSFENPQDLKPIVDE